MRTRVLGTSGLEVSAIGLGCMPMSSSYGTVDVDEAQATLEEAVELGVTFWDTAEIYGDGGNELLIAPVLQRHRDRVVIATKFGFELSTGQPRGLDSRPATIRRTVEESLRRLRTDHIDLLYQRAS